MTSEGILLYDKIVTKKTISLTDLRRAELSEPPAFF